LFLGFRGSLPNTTTVHNLYRIKQNHTTLSKVVH
jgi:hypothetical protein